MLIALSSPTQEFTSTTCPVTFSSDLSHSIEHWQSEQIRGVWLKIPTAASQLVPVAIQHHQFDYHHASSGYVMLTRWLPTDCECKLPPAASHFVGVGGFVVDVVNRSTENDVVDIDNMRVLVVQEKSGPTAGMGVWKLPGGLVDQGKCPMRLLLPWCCWRC